MTAPINVFLAGVGGQGLVLVNRLLARAAINSSTPANRFSTASTFCPANRRSATIPTTGETRQPSAIELRISARGVPVTPMLPR